MPDHDSKPAGPPDFSFEAAALALGLGPVAGVDEAGRGPWAGPVVAAAVILDPANIPSGLNDSKKLSATQRESLFATLMDTGQISLAIGEHERIDRDNVLAATLWAMGEAVAGLPVAAGCALIDGNRAPRLNCPVRTIVKGDGRSLSIAAASIIAKVTRDRIMVDLDGLYPGYGFARHKGYGTKIHSEALHRLGPCPVHRKSFAPVRALMT